MATNPFSPIRQTTGYKEIQDAIVNRPFVEVPKTTRTPDFSKDMLQTQPSDQAVVATLPSRIGGGSYVTDPTSLNEVMKSERADFRTDNLDKQLRQGLDSRFYQIEHIMPLWAGGTNDASNLQIIFNKDHENKTAVGNIARALYYNKKIDLGEARNTVLNWKDKNTEGIIADDEGNVDVALAENRFKEWQQPIKVGLKETLAGLASFLPFVGKSITKKLDPGAEIYREALIEGPKSVAGQTAQAVASGVTFGWIPTGQRQFEGTEATAAGVGKFVGQVAGTLVGFGVLAKAIGKIGKVTGITKKLKGTEYWGKVMESVAKEDKLIKAGFKKPYLGPQTLMKMAGSAGLFAVGGQISKFEENTFRERAEQLIHDLTLGGVVGKAGIGLKGITGVGATSFGLSYIMDQDQDNRLNNAFLSGVTMAALHGVGGRVHQAKFNKAVNQEGVNRAMEWRKEYLPEAKENPTAIDLATESTKITETLTKKYKNDSETLYKKKQTLDIVNKMLYKETLSKPKRDIEDAKDMISLARRIEGPINESNGVNTEMNEFIRLNPDVFGEGAREKPLDIKPLPPEKVIEGTFQVTGYGKNISPEVRANIITLAEAIHTGKADKTVWLYKRPELKSTIESKNRTMDPKLIKEGKEKTYENPEKNVAFTKPLNGQNVRLGTVPREWKIEGAPYSINKGIREHNKLYPDIPFTEFDPTKINKNTISDNMDLNNSPVIRGEITMITDGKGTKNGGYGVTTGSGEPAMIIKITKQGVEESVARSKGIKTQSQLITEKIVESLKTFDPNRKSYDILRDLDVSITNEKMKINILSTRNEAYGFIEKIAREIETGSKESLEKLVKQEVGVVNKEALNNIIKKGDKATMDDALFLANENLLESLKHDTDFLATWNTVKGELLVKPKAELVTPPIEKVPELTKKLELKEPVAKEPRIKFEITKIKELPTETVGKELEKRVDILRKESDMMAKAEDTGVKYRETEYGMIKDWNLKYQKKGMKWQGDAFKKEARELLYENDPEFRKIQDEFDNRLDKELDIDIKQREKLTDKIYDQWEDKKIPQIEKEISQIKEYEPQPKEIITPTKDIEEGKRVSEQKTEEIIKPEIKKEQEIKEEIKQESEEAVEKPMETETKEYINEESDITEPAKISDDISAGERSKIALIAEPKEIQTLSEYKSFNPKKEGGGHKATIIELDKDIIKFREAGDLKKALEVEMAKEFTDRNTFTAKAKELKKKHDGNIDKAFEEFRDSTNKHFQKISGNSEHVYMADNNITRKAFANWAEVIEGGTRKAVITKGKGAELEVKIEDVSNTDIHSELTKNNEIITIDSELGQKEIRDALSNNKEKFILLGFKSNTTSLAVKYKPEYVEMYNKNPKEFTFLEDPKIMTHEEKFRRVLIKNDIGFPQNETYKEFKKRLALFDNRELPLNLPNTKWKTAIIKDPSIKDVEGLYKQKLIDESYIKDSKKEDIDNTRALATMDGMVMVLKKETWKDIQKVAWLDPSISHGKPVGNWKRQMKNPDGTTRNQMVLQKGMFFLATENDIKFLKKQGLTDKQLKELDMVTVDSNVKVGLKDIAELSPGYRELDIPANSYRLQHSNPGESEARLPQALISKLIDSASLGPMLKNAVNKMFGRGASKFMKFRKKVTETDDMKEVAKLFKEEYKYNLEENLHGFYKEAYQQGASKEFLQQIIERSMNNVFQDKVLGYRHIASTTFKIRPDTGYIKDGKTVFNKPGEVRMNQSMANKLMEKGGEYVLSIRNPISDVFAISKDKVIIDNNIPNGEVIASHHDVRIRKQGDFDGDSYGVFKVGGKDGIEPVIADWFETNRSKHGDIVLSEPTQRAEESGSFSDANVLRTIEGQALGVKAINTTQALSRILVALKTTNTRFEVKAGEIKMLHGRELSSKSSIDKKAKSDIMFNVVYDRKQIILSRDILQKALDSVKDPEALKRMNWTTKYFLGKVLKPSTKAAKEYKFSLKELQQINELINGTPQKDAVTRPFQGFQEIHKLNNTDNTIGAKTKGTPESAKYLVERTEEMIEFNDSLERKGAELSPLLEQINALRGMKRIMKLDPKGHGAIDRKAVLLVKENYSDTMNELLKRPNVKEIEKKMHEVRVRYLDKKIPFEEKGLLRDDVLNLFKDNYSKYNKEDIDGIAYLAATSNDGNIKHGIDNFGKDFPDYFYAWRYNELIRLSPEVAKTYYDGYRLAPKVVETKDIKSEAVKFDKKSNIIEINTEKIEVDFKNKEWTKPKIKGAMKLPENAFKTIDEYKKFIIEEAKGRVIYSKSRGETTIEYENRMIKAAMLAIGKRIIMPNVPTVAQPIPRLPKIDARNPVDKIKDVIKKGPNI